MKLVQKEQSGIDLYRLQLEPVNDEEWELIQSFKLPGQYATVKIETNSYFAMASLPGASPIEFLIKDSESAASFINQPVGSEEIKIDSIQGNGFNLNKIDETKKIHLFSMGSGIAPLRSLILYILDAGLPHAGITLWQGSFTEDHLPYMNEYSHWENKGIQVEICLDDDVSIKRNIIDAIRENKPDLKNAICYWIGSQEFGKAIEKVTGQYGLPGDSLFTNF